MHLKITKTQTHIIFTFNNTSNLVLPVQLFMREDWNKFLAQEQHAIEFKISNNDRTEPADFKLEKVNNTLYFDYIKSGSMMFMAIADVWEDEIRQLC